MSALQGVADNFIFIRDTEADVARGYQGPWQVSHARDIDPSSLLTTTRGNNGRRAWWSPVEHGAWKAGKGDAHWLRSRGDVPAVQPLLVVSRPQDASEWIVLECLRDFDQPTPPDAERFEVPRCRIWLWIKSYLVRKREAGRLRRWLLTQDLWGRWMPESSETTKVFLGEFFWAPAFSTFNLPYYSHPGWTESSADLSESASSCACDDGKIHEGNGLRWLHRGHRAHLDARQGHCRRHEIFDLTAVTESSSIVMGI